MKRSSDELPDFSSCKIYITTKAGRKLFDHKSTKTSKPTELLYMSVVSVRTPTWNNHKYFVTVIDI